MWQPCALSHRDELKASPTRWVFLLAKTTLALPARSGENGAPPHSSSLHPWAACSLCSGGLGPGGLGAVGAVPAQGRLWAPEESHSKGQDPCGHPSLSASHPLSPPARCRLKAGPGPSPARGRSWGGRVATVTAEPRPLENLPPALGFGLRERLSTLVTGSPGQGATGPRCPASSPACLLPAPCGQAPEPRWGLPVGPPW